MNPLSDVSPSAINTALTQAGIEVYRVVGSEIQIAERIRLHIMDSGVRVATGGQLKVVFRARSQRSDYPHMSADELILRVKDAIGTRATAQGFHEETTETRELRDPTSQDLVLDVWHEVTYAKHPSSVEALIEDVRWALALDKYVSE